MKVLIFGLGLHTGGISAANYFISQGHTVHITDLKDEESLKPALKYIYSSNNVTYRLGRHSENDFNWADLVIKNTAVPIDSPLLSLSKKVETDLSFFLKINNRPLAAVTGTKGKTSTAYIIYHLLKPFFSGTDIAGNMGISLFELLNSNFAKDTLHDPVVIEVSSWQLRDLKFLKTPLKCNLSVLTALYRDHINTYREGFKEYLEDKSFISDNSFKTITLLKNKKILNEQGIQLKNSEFIDTDNILLSHLFSNQDSREILDFQKNTYIPLDNIILAASAAEYLNPKIYNRLKGLKEFKSLPHRMEYLGSWRSLHFINDSSSTIPEAVLHAVTSVSGKIILLCGGTDKSLFTDAFVDIYRNVDSIYLLPGSFSNKLSQLFDANEIPYTRIHHYNFSQILSYISNNNLNKSDANSKKTILFSPGAASFEHFPNEKVRGDKFTKAVKDFLKNRY
ncbi:MAG: UDP-N-acetylmuramoyl-L-alanine--D-glutamate ligase [Spirochaetia bacterium]|nr:UDP-N-acetylmuramoyl-L-alanine--D-glutamate ligase [Spirochaetia bacterium]